MAESFPVEDAPGDSLVDEIDGAMPMCAEEPPVRQYAAAARQS